MTSKPFDSPVQPEDAPTIGSNAHSSQITLTPAESALSPTSPTSTTSSRPLLHQAIDRSAAPGIESKGHSTTAKGPAAGSAAGSKTARLDSGSLRESSISSTILDQGLGIKGVTDTVDQGSQEGSASSSSSSISPEANHTNDPAKRPLKSRLWDIWVKNWFLVGLVVAIILARFFPDWGRTGGPIKPEYTVKYGFTSMIFLLSGLGLKTKDLFISALNYRAHLMVQLTSFIVIPMFVKAVTSLVGLSTMNATLLAGMLVTAATPTTISSNVVMTANASGNESLALFNAAFGNLLGVFISPVIVLILLHSTPESPSGQNGLDYPKILRDLGLTILVPILVGQVYLYYFPNSVAWMKRKVHFPTLNSSCLLILVWSVFCDAFYSKTFDFVTAGEIVAVAVMQGIIFWLMTFFLGIVARLRPRRIRQLKAIAVEQAEIAREQRRQREQQEVDGDVEVQPSAEEAANQPLRSRFQELVEPMSKKDTVAILFCGATKSVAMGVPMIKVLYDSPNGSQLGGLLATPLLIYHVEQLFSGAFMVPWLKGWVGRGEETVESFEENMDDDERISTNKNKRIKKWWPFKSNARSS
ncbi:hypothetical protein BGZ73_002664 [Actinomortierella ambigua]|nr:hypothetical protein BGZ73_002664 [Actinomortierella ambigua]